MSPCCKDFPGLIDIEMGSSFTTIVHFKVLHNNNFSFLIFLNSAWFVSASILNAYKYELPKGFHCLELMPDHPKSSEYNGKNLETIAS